MKTVYKEQNIFFISDLHLGHNNILKFDKRPFADLQEMYVQLIKNWNSVVGDDDVVYNLGDLSFGKDELAIWFMNSVKGKIHHVMGNHDKMKDILKISRIEQVYEYGTEIFVEDPDTLDRAGKEQQIIMSHYPILSWNRAHHGSWHLHGHCHGSLLASNQEYYKRNVMDVGCNCIGYTPISYQQVKDTMKKRLIVIDRHIEKI